MDLQKECLELLATDSRLTISELARLLNTNEETISKQIKQLEDDGIILKYNTVINWEKLNDNIVSAFIEVKMTPERGVGFDKVAERLYRYPQVKSVYLMSGVYDLAVIIEGNNIKEVSQFVSDKLAVLEQVQSTTTHFVLKKYKQDGVIFSKEESDRRLVITP